jgi:hypothetical protein
MRVVAARSEPRLEAAPPTHRSLDYSGAKHGPIAGYQDTLTL